jgi:membrane-associated phospholipid phosphatase
MNYKAKVARSLSVIGHPFVFLLLLVFVVLSAKESIRSTLGLLGIVALFLAPHYIYMLFCYKSRRWKSMDASLRAERPSLYFSACIVIVSIGVYFLFTGQPNVLIEGCVVIVCMLGAAAALNRWLKLSMHMAFNAFTGVIVNQIDGNYGLLIYAYMPGLAWSRLVLSKHTPKEVIGGILLGMIVGLGAIWLFPQK